MVNNSSIDWLFPWPDEALLAVATELIAADNRLIPGEFRQSIIEHHVDVHKSVIDVSQDFVTTLRRQNYVTPRNFLDFIATYQVHTGFTKICLSVCPSVANLALAAKLESLIRTCETRNMGQNRTKGRPRRRKSD